MRAVIAQAFGPPESFSVEEVAAPEPGPGEVTVAVRSVGLHFADLLISSGKYQVQPSIPFSPGSEFSGVVRALGEGVANVRVGDRVTAGTLGGALAEVVRVRAAGLVRLPDGMGFDEGSVFRAPYETSYHALVQRGRLAPGETVLVMGAAGAVGLAAVQLAKALGANVIASVSSEAKRAVALEGGADWVIDSGAADWREQVKTLTDGRGVDVAFDPVGGEQTERAFRSLAWKGRHLVIGFTAGQIPRLPVNLALLKGAELVGVEIRRFGLLEPEVAQENARRLAELYAQGVVRPKIARRYPLERYVEAMQAVASGQVAGRVVVTVSEG